jgi:type IV pilus assembly protein PilN
MAHINLLPWRAELLKQKQREFAFTAGGGVLLAGLIVLLSHVHFDGRIEDQNMRNSFLQSEINILNQRIGRIREMEKMKDDLLARMNVIQELQSSRPESVHLLDELVRTLPDGVYLDSFAQNNRTLEMDGKAQSNARISDYMRNIDSSQWLAGPRLDLITSSQASRNRVANFKLHSKQKEHKPEDEKGTRANARAGTAGKAG